MSQPPSARTRVRRIPENAVYQRESVYAILDDSFLCHIAFADEQGPHCLPMAYWRRDDALYIHGSNGSRLMKRLAGGAPVCVSVSHLDGLVLARSAFNHSMNYRSVMIYGQFVALESAVEKAAALDDFMHQLAPGREHEARSGSPQELGATLVLKISLDEAVAKVRSGGPQDDARDQDLALWTGVLPYQRIRSAPQAADDCADVALPDYVRDWAA